MPPVPLSACDKILAQGLSPLGIKFFSRPVARATVSSDDRGQCQGFGTCMPLCPSGAQYAAIYHVEKAEKLGVRLIPDVRVDRLFESGAITHVEARRPNGELVEVTGKIFVLAANGVETPRLLLMSAGESRPAGIGNSSGQIGRNFMDHPTLISRMLMPAAVWQGRGPVTIMASHDFRDGDFRRHRPAWLLSTDNRPHTQDVAMELINAGVEPPALDKLIREKASRIVHIEGCIEQQADNHNSIKLDWSRRDRAGQPLIQQYYSLGDYEQSGLEHMRAEFKKYAQHLHADILAEYGPVTSHHQIGMARMGSDPKNSVTDSFGRCHDHPNLFICSGALFPSAACVNPTLTIAALAIRSAEKIAAEISR